MRIVLVCDHKWRDLPALVVIRDHLRRLDHHVFIASAKEFESLLPLYQPDAVVLNHFWDERYRKLARQLRNAGIAVLVLPTEGSGSTDLWGPMITGSFSDYSLIDFKMCWNGEWANGIAAAGTMPRERLDIVGCPRFDFAVPPLVETCMSREELCKRMGLDASFPIVCFAGNFAIAKLAYAAPHELASFERQSDEIGFSTSIAARGFTTKELIAIYKSNLDKFIDAFANAAIALPNCQFVYKPHPNNDVSYIRERLAAVAPKNSVVAIGVYISDVLRGANVLVNSNCTTSIEAWLHDVPVIDAQLEADPITGRPDIAACNWVATDAEEIIAGIRRGLQEDAVSSKLAQARRAFIEKWFHKVDGRRCEAAARSIDTFVRGWGRRRRLYPVRHGGGARTVARGAAGWLLGLPGGAALTDVAATRGRDLQGSGVFDKVITRHDVRAMQRHLEPVLTAVK